MSKYPGFTDHGLRFTDYGLRITDYGLCFFTTEITEETLSFGYGMFTINAILFLLQSEEG